MLWKKCGFEYVCSIFKFFCKISPDKIKTPFFEYNLKERIERSYFWECCNVIEKLSDIDQDTRIKAAKVFAKWKKRMTICILDRRMSKEPDSVVRYWIATAIGEIGGRYAKKALLRAMGDEDPYVRLGVTDALEKQGKRVLKEVIKHAKSDNPLIRQSVVKVLCNIGRGDPHVSSVLDQLKGDPEEGMLNIFNMYCKNFYKKRDHYERGGEQ